ncbi:excisionase family DNA-binding protein [Actinosynnema sp. NPDC023587]|uniref:excisionase family DNA-binding protein n=1 Tax=Actinosynnema sp. NPDC023587 TaxID=3154695 RepID=UPI0033C40F0C
MEHRIEVTLVTVQAAADMMSVSRWSVYRLIWDNAIQSVQVGRSRRVVKASLDAYVRDLIEEAA